MRWFAIGFLAAEGIGAVLWWIAIVCRPALRPLFFPTGTPDFVWMALFVPDMVLFAAAGSGAAWGLVARHKWAWMLLCIHTGGALYACLAAVGYSVLTGEAWVGGAMMAPPILILPYLAWHLRPSEA
jgi:hypothetical protein